MIFGATLEQWAEFFKMAAAFLTLAAGIITPIAYPFYRKFSEKVATDTAAQAVGIQQQNNYLESRNAPQVTQAAPPSSTGDGRADLAMAKLLPPSAPAAAVPHIDYLELGRVMQPMVEAAIAARFPAAPPPPPPAPPAEPAVGPA